ncbi:hypothetical protein KKG05_00675 [bacterium]|nr:hypothetical protein [bacterium]
MKNSKITLAMFIALLAMALFVFIGCPSNKKDETPTGPNPEDYMASGSFTSETNGTIETATGASITVPVGAVPLTTSGETGSMVFSIERNTSIQATPPTGETMMSDVYQFGPDGFVLARPAEITIPVTGEGDPGDVKLYRINPTTGEPELRGGIYDPDTRTISAQTYEFSPWFSTGSSRNEMVWGCIHVNNNTGKWLYLCVEEYTFTYPDLDGAYTELNSLWAPSGTIGWASSGDWFVPQGTYKICQQVLKSGVSNSCAADSCYEHNYRENVVVDEPWHHDFPHCTTIDVGSLVNPVTGRCACNPIPTPSVGTGDIQVTLTWYNTQSIDLDLWVTEPDTTICAYWNKMTVNGDTLDRDNRCGNYENGRPENIYSTRQPLAGEYIVQVDWFSACGNSITSQAFNVRVVVGGQTNTYSGTITPDPRTLEVTRFTVSGTTVRFGPYTGIPVDTRGIPRPEKTAN